MASAWDIDIKRFDALAEDAQTDVVIVGGGLAGVWSAYCLAKKGKKVIVLEADRLGRAATLYTTAFLTHILDTDEAELAEIFGKEKASLATRAHKEAIDRIESVAREEGIDCEFVRLPITVAGETTPNQAKYHPMKFFKGLVEACQSLGVRFYEESEVAKIERDELEQETITAVTKGGCKVEAKDLIVTTYQPLDNTNTHLKKGMYVSYVFELEIPNGAIAECMYIDDMNPYHYMRVDALPGRDRMIVGGEDHRAELGFLDDKSFKALEDFVKTTYPTLDYTIKNRWQGGILEPSDGLALIGTINEHEYVATAFSGNGMTYSAITGSLLSDLITGEVNPYAEVFDPARTIGPKALALKARDYTEEFFGGAVKNLFK